MSQNLTLGPVLVFDNSVAAINFALIELQDRTDKARGIKGRTLVHDRLRVSDDTEADDAVNQRSINRLAQGAVGNILTDTATITLTYDATIPEIFAAVTSLVYLTDGSLPITGPLAHTGALVGFFGTPPAAQVPAVPDASVAHAVSDFATANTALNALGAKINALIDFAQAHGAMAT
jgi:hypothetical protein